MKMKIELSKKDWDEIMLGKYAPWNSKARVTDVYWSGEMGMEVHISDEPLTALAETDQPPAIVQPAPPTTQHCTCSDGPYRSDAEHMDLACPFYNDIPF